MEAEQIISPDDKKKLDDLICLHTGTFGTRYLSKDFLNLEKSGIVFQHVANRHLLRIERNKMSCEFYRSSPGIGTKVVSLDLSQMSNDKSEEFQLLFSWSPKEISAGIVSLAGSTIGGKAQPSKRNFRAMLSKEVYAIGDAGIQVMGTTMVSGNSIVFEPTGIEQWQEIKNAVDHLLSHKPDKDFLYESLVCCQALSMVVTGFENFLKRRFVELDEEGVSIDYDKLLKCCYSDIEIENQLHNLHLKEAGDNKKSFVGYLIYKRKISFQSLSEAKKLYKAAYGLVFGNLIKNTTIESANKYIRYRHRIIHVSPLQVPLNLIEMNKGAEPVYANHDTIKNAFSVFDEFISCLNEGTLYLERKAWHN